MLLDLWPFEDEAPPVVVGAAAARASVAMLSAADLALSAPAKATASAMLLAEATPSVEHRE